LLDGFDLLHADDGGRQAFAGRGWRFMRLTAANKERHHA
jgi:hypothetical protein